MAQAAADFLQSQRFTYADLSDAYANLEDLYSRKLWHQLTVALADFVKNPASHRGDNLIQLYEKFIAPVELKLNQLQLVLIASSVAAQFMPSQPAVADEVDRAAAFLGRFIDKRGRISEDAFLVASMELASVKLRKAAPLAAAADAAGLAALLDGVKADIAAGKELLAALPEGGDPVVPATFYRASAEYYKVRGPASAFYAAALRWLAHTSVDALPPPVRAEVAVDVALAALVGDGVYDFGEVNAHPILAALDGTPHAWLRQLLAAFQTGAIDAFNAVVASHRAAFESQPALVAASAAIKEKVALLAVMELAGRKPPAERTLGFDEVAAETRLPGDQVEWVLMRAFSLGLLRGTIDQVDRVAHVSYVRPRVLDAGQVAGLKARVDEWRSKAHGMLLYLEDNSRELMV